MPQQLLNGAQIRTVLQQVAGKRMAQHVRRQFRRRDPGARGLGSARLVRAAGRLRVGDGVRCVRREPVPRRLGRRASTIVCVVASVAALAVIVAGVAATGAVLSGPLPEPGVLLD